MITRRHSLALALGAALVAGSAARAAEPEDVYGFNFTGIDGAPMPLEAYRGKVLLVVNTASRCGFTGQYEGLQALWSARRGENFTLIGVPSADFNQELGSEAAVKQFCEATFAIDFPLTAITRVTGVDAHPFFAHAAAAVGAPSWNFNKYLVDQRGQIVRRYGSVTRPATIARDIDALLGAS